MMTLRSNDQFNTTVYGYDDRFRGIHGTRAVILMNRNDIVRLGLAENDRIEAITVVDDGVHRAVGPLRVTPYSIPEAAAQATTPNATPCCRSGTMPNAARCRRPSRFRSGCAR